MVRILGMVAARRKLCRRPDGRQSRFIPSNSLASVYGLVAECARERVLGADVNIEIETYDEWNTVINVCAVAKRIRAAGCGMVGLVGVQSNQFPRRLI